jgi:glycosyltransferase involved in cell wall biosynthesis
MVLGWQEVSLLQAMLAARRLGLALILRGESNDLRSRTRPVARLQKLLFQQFDYFLSIGRANAELYMARGVPADRIGTAGYFVDNSRFVERANELAPLRPRLRQQWGIPPEAVCFCFVGKLEPKKRVLDFVKAIARASENQPNIHGLVVGSGEQMAVAKQLVQQLRAPIVFAGFLNQTEVPSAYAAADALVLASDFGETWGLVVNEVMASGRPAIVSNRAGCARDLILEGRTGSTFPFGDVDELARVIALWASKPDLLAELGNNARAHVLNGYSVETAVERTISAVDAAIRLRSNCHSIC